MINEVPRQINNENFGNLHKIPSKEEVKAAVILLSRYNVGGPDGMT